MSYHNRTTFIPLAEEHPGLAAHFTQVEARYRRKSDDQSGLELAWATLEMGLHPKTPLSTSEAYFDVSETLARQYLDGPGAVKEPSQVLYASAPLFHARRTGFSATNLISAQTRLAEFGDRLLWGTDADDIDFGRGAIGRVALFLASLKHATPATALEMAYFPTSRRENASFNTYTVQSVGQKIRRKNLVRLRHTAVQTPAGAMRTPVKDISLILRAQSLFEQEGLDRQNSRRVLRWIIQDACNVTLPTEQHAIVDQLSRSLSYDM